MNTLLITHIAGGSLAILSGAIAVVARKGGPKHSLAGTWFFGSMLVLGITAALLAATLPIPDPSRVTGGLFAVYFATTSFAAARWRKGKTGAVEIWACAAIVLLGLTLVGIAIAASRSAVGLAAHGSTFYLILASFCGVFSLLDLNVILRPTISGKARISRHVWRMCLAFFFATGSFFLGQQKVMPAGVRGSAILWALGLFPLAVMLFWLVRIRFSSAIKGVSGMLRPLGRILADQHGV